MLFQALLTAFPTTSLNPCLATLPGKRPPPPPHGPPAVDNRPWTLATIQSGKHGTQTHANGIAGLEQGTTEVVVFLCTTAWDSVVQRDFLGRGSAGDPPPSSGPNVCLGAWVGRRGGGVPTTCTGQSF